MNKLKLCPFCNGEAKIQYSFPNRQGNRCKEVFVKCKVCNAKNKDSQAISFAKVGRLQTDGYFIVEQEV